MKGKLDAYVQLPLAKRVQNWIVDLSATRNIMVKPFQNKKGQKNLRYPTKKQYFSLEKEPFFWKQSAKIWNRRTQKFIPHSLIISCPVNRALPVFLVNYDALELKWDFGNGLAPYLLLKFFLTHSNSFFSWLLKVHIFWEGQKIFLRNLHLTFDWHYKSKVEISQNFVAFSEHMNFSKNNT